MNGHRRKETQSLLETIGSYFQSPFTVAEVFAKIPDQVAPLSRKQLGSTLREQSRLSPELIPRVFIVGGENGSRIWHLDFSTPASDAARAFLAIERAFAGRESQH